MSETKVTQLALPLANEAIVVHCFFNPTHSVQSDDPQQAHDLMERHYAEKHAAQLERICGTSKGRKS